MRTLISILVISGLALMAFSYWGVETESGRRAYDEMDGIIPIAAGVLGALLLALAIVFVIVRFWRSRRHTQQ
jgi:hypothetical protein